MASNFDGDDNKQLVRQYEFVTEPDKFTIQRIIDEQMQIKPWLRSIESIYHAVRQRLAELKYHWRLDGIQNRILKMIESSLQGLQLKQKPAIEYNNYESKLKSQRSEKKKNETAKSNQLSHYDRGNYLALQEEKEKDEQQLNLVLLQSKKDFDDEMEFEKKLKETLAKSYQEEKSKLLNMLSGDNIDFSVLSDQLNKVWPDKTSVAFKDRSLNDRSAVILAIIELFDYDHTIIDAKPIQNHITTLGEFCSNVHSNAIYQKCIHQKSLNSTFNVFTINDYLVNIEIRGDGNCMWGSVSHSLFGDYSMMQSLRLLTANALMHSSEIFVETLNRQISEFSYNALTLEQLIKASVSLQSWGDEFHLMALSLTLKRPIYSYGSLIEIPKLSYMSYDQFRQSYETEQFPNHFKFIGDARDANNEPILLHYDGFSHYSSVLKTSHYVKPLVPFTQIIDALVNGNEMSQPGEVGQLVDIDCEMTGTNTNVDLDGSKSAYSSVQEYGGISDEISKVHSDLREKVRQYESFFQQVKKMLDCQKIDLALLQGLVDSVESIRK